MHRSSRLRLLFVFALLLGFVFACAQGNQTTASDLAPTPAHTSDPALPTPPATPPAETPPPPPPADDQALVPEVDSVTPDKATVGSVGPSIVVSGNNFVSRSIVQLDGAPLATTFVSGTELRATIPTSKLAAVGVLRISAGTSPPGGGASKEITFSVENPAATLTAIAPLSVVAGSGTTSLHVTGTGFVAGAKVVFGPTDLVTTYNGATSLDATIPASLLAASGSEPVKVVNPAPGGGDSTTIAFTISNPNATIQSVTPSSAIVSASATAIVVKGSGYVALSEIVFNGASLTTTYVSAGELHATISAAALSAAGDFPVVVSNPPPGGGLTAPYTFHVVYPAPTIASLSPSTTNAGAAPTDVTVTGSGFYAASQITFDGAPAATTFLDGAHVKATLSAAQLASGGAIQVRVTTPAPGGGTSTALAFTVNNPVPTITSINPTSATVGSPDKLVNVYGTSFLPSSTVRSNGVTVTTTYVSATQVNAVVPSSHLLNPGTVTLTVTNAAPGGGTSAGKSLVVGCDTSGVDVALGAIGNVTMLATNFGAAPQMSRFDDGSNSCNTTALLVATQPARFWVVQNTAGTSVTLSAWAVCTADAQQDDAYLTFYRRPTVPANDSERLACTNVIAEGINGGAGMGSPESGSSSWCPGLTKANGGGLVLAACEKVVVHMQPWSNTSATYTMPPQIKLQPE